MAWALVLLALADPQPCEQVQGMPGVWRCPGENVCRDGLCVPPPERKPAAPERRPPPPDKSPTDRNSTSHWIRRNLHAVVEVGPYLGRDTPGVLESGDPGVSFDIGIVAQLKQWLAIEVPFGYAVREFSSRTLTAIPGRTYDDRMSLEQFSLAALARFDLRVGRVRLSAGAGPELTLANLGVSATQNFPPEPPFQNTFRFDEDILSAHLGLQWFAGFETPADARVRVGLAYRGRYVHANFSPLVQGDADVGGNAILFRVSLLPDPASAQGTTTSSSTYSTSMPHRSGFTLELGIGLGLEQYQPSYLCSYSGCPWAWHTGLAPLSLSLGGFINNNWAILFRTASTSYFYTGMDGSTQLFGSYFYGVIVERWVGEHWMFSAGPGYALSGNSGFIVPSDTAPGFGISARAAYSFVAWEHHSLKVAFEMLPAMYPALLLAEAVNIEWQWF